MKQMGPQAGDAYDDQIKSDDVVQEPRHGENKYAGDQCRKRLQNNKLTVAMKTPGSRHGAASGAGPNLNKSRCYMSPPSIRRSPAGSGGLVDQGNGMKYEATVPIERTITAR